MFRQVGTRITTNLTTMLRGRMEATLFAQALRCDSIDLRNMIRRRRMETFPLMGATPVSPRPRPMSPEIRSPTSSWDFTILCYSNAADHVRTVSSSFNGTNGKPMFKTIGSSLRKLTLNLGMRYIYDVPFHEVHGQANVWDTGCNCFLTPGNGIDGLIKPDRNNFAPRFGFAYSITPKTVIRGGTGVYYGFIRGSELSSGYGLNPPFLTSTTVNNGTTAPTLSAGLFPVPTAVVTSTTNLFSVSHTLPNNYTYQYNATVQRQITPTLALQAAYVGSSSHKLIGRDLVNQGRVDANPSVPTSILSRRPFQGAADISITKAIDQANYNALQVTIEKRPSHGISALAAYTYGKSMGIAEAGDQSAIGNEYVPRGRYYGPTVYSQKHRLTISPTVELPFGSGKAFANSLPTFVDKVVSGWSANSIMTFSTGEYISPTSNISANVGRVDRNFPNCIGDPMKGSGIRTLTRWFDTSKVVPQPAGTFGNCSTGVIQVPGQNNIDISAVKNTTFRDRYRVEFRSESSSTPSTTLASASRT